MQKRIFRRSAPMLLVMLCFALCAATQGTAEQAERLRKDALELTYQGKYNEALPLARQALQIREALSPEGAETASALGALGTVLRGRGDYQEAEQVHQRALLMCQKLFGSEHLETARAQNDLGIVFTTVGEFAKAEPLFKQGLATREKLLGPRHADTAASLSNLGALYFELGNYAKAEPLFQRTVRIREQTLGPEHRLTATALDNLASLYQTNVAFANAEPLYLRALRIKTKVLGADHPDLAVTLNNLASLYSNTGAYSKALQMSQRALAIQEKAQQNDPILAQTLGSIASAYDMLEDYANAELLYQRALEVSVKLLGEDHPQTLQLLHLEGMLYNRKGEYAKAAAVNERVVAASERVLGEHPATAAALSSLGEAYRASGAYDKAEPVLQRAAAIFERTMGPNHFEKAENLQELAVLYWASGRAAKAVPVLERVLRINSRNTEPYLAGGSEIRKQRFLAHQRGSVMTNVSFSVAVSGAAGARLGLLSVLQYKSLALEAMSDSVGRLRQNLRTSDRAIFEQLSTVANELSVLTYRDEGALSATEFRQRSDALLRRQEELEARLSGQSAEYRSEAATVTVASLQAALPQDAALVEWFRYTPLDPKATLANARWGAPRYVAYLLRHSGDPIVIDGGTAEQIESLVRELRAAASNPRRTNVRQHAAAVSRLLVEPLRAHLGGVRQLLISPDSALNFVPMAALLYEQRSYLAERFEITNLTSGRDLLRLQASRRLVGSRPVVMADPDYGKQAVPIVATAEAASRLRSADLDRSGLSFRALPGTALEARAIERLLHDPTAQVLTGREATEANLKELHGPRILHLATHGFFMKDQQAALPEGKQGAPGSGVEIENPLLRSGLALAGANARRSGTKDDGILTALEASRLDLHGTQLVVLSACETALGDTRNGDGIAGLRRGLLLAGAQTQVSSLWKVGDIATEKLMVKFYQHLVRGAGRSEAMRRAQLEILANPEQAHPYYWASFAVIGDWTPLRGAPLQPATKTNAH